jgi:succinate dehydrogenase / fumarate reductase cytochrome b subunit
LVLWGARTGLLLSVFLHVLFTIQLTRRNRLSRPETYAQYHPTKASVASRTMIWGGLFLVAFVVFHLLHFTVGSAHPNFSHTDIYTNMVIGFSSWPVSIFYLAAMFFLGMHLYHGVCSVFQTLGFNNPAVNNAKRPLASLLAIAIPAGFASIPVAVLIGWLK